MPKLGVLLGPIAAISEVPMGFARTLPEGLTPTGILGRIGRQYYLANYPAM